MPLLAVIPQNSKCLCNTQVRGLLNVSILLAYSLQYSCDGSKLQKFGEKFARTATFEAKILVLLHYNERR